MNSVDNVIIRNIIFRNRPGLLPQWDPTDGPEGNWNSNSTESRSALHHVWIDHNEFSDGAVLDRDLPEYFGREFRSTTGSWTSPTGPTWSPSPTTLRDHDRPCSSAAPTRQPTTGKLRSPCTTTAGRTCCSALPGPLRAGPRVQQPLRDPATPEGEEPTGTRGGRRGDPRCTRRTTTSTSTRPSTSPRSSPTGRAPRCTRREATPTAAPGTTR